MDEQWSLKFKEIELENGTHYSIFTNEKGREFRAIPKDKFFLDLVVHIERQQAFSIKTFGPPGEGQKHQGVIDHIKKELVEIEEDPSNLDEWVDCMILSFDGAIKGGHSPEAIVRALVAKQSKNERRKWPNWREVDLTKAIEHDRSNEEPKVSEAKVDDYCCVSCGRKMGTGHLDTCEFHP